MIDPAHDDLSISAQCRLLSISRSSFYYAPVPETGETLALMQVSIPRSSTCPGKAAVRWPAICAVSGMMLGVGVCGG